MEASVLPRREEQAEADARFTGFHRISPTGRNGTVVPPAPLALHSGG